MNPTMVTEKELRPISGYLAMFAWIFGLLVSTASFIFGCIGLALEFYLIGSILMVLSLIGWTLFSVLLGGLKVVHPVEARIFTLFGNYYGTIKQPGFFFINPFCISFSPDFAAARATAAANIRTRGTNATPPLVTAQQISLMSRAISLKTQTLDNGLQKVNDVLGNPIIIGAIVIWRVSNPTQAVFAVENYRGYLASQTDSTIRNVARLYPYDNFSEDDSEGAAHEKTLRGSAQEIAKTMQAELQKRVTDAGLTIEEVRITHLAYAEEIAAAMLQRQQAEAIIAARQKIVDGAVGMVKMAIQNLGADDIVRLDDERKAAMVSNLLVVLCGSRDPQPVVSTGSIY